MKKHIEICPCCGENAEHCECDIIRNGGFQPAYCTLHDKDLTPEGE